MAATCPRLIIRIKNLTEAERTVVQCKSTDGAVVAVEVALTVAYPDPVGHKRREPASELARKRQHFLGCIELLVDNVAVFPINNVQDNLFERLQRPWMRSLAGTTTEQFQWAPSDGRRGDPCCDGNWL